MNPMEQFQVEPVLGRHLHLFGYDVSFTNSALFMVVVFVALALFMAGGLKRQLIPGRWQVAVEGAVGFIDNMVATSIGPEGKKFAPYLFSLFFFILFANLVGVMPLAILPPDCSSPRRRASPRRVPREVSPETVNAHT